MDWSKDIREWFSEAENYSIVHYAIERGVSKEWLEEEAKRDEGFKEALEYALSVQEYKLVEGALGGALDRAVVMEMLRTYNGWGKKDSGGVVNVALFSDEVFGKMLERYKESRGVIEVKSNRIGGYE